LAEQHGPDAKDWLTHFATKQNRVIWLAFSSFLVKKSKCWKTNRTISRRHDPSLVKKPGESRVHLAGADHVVAPVVAAECADTTAGARRVAMAATVRVVSVAAIDETTANRTTVQADLVRKATAQTVLQAAALNTTTIVVESSKVVQTPPTGDLQIAVNLDVTTVDDGLAQTW
jgi:hypothetical protein